MYPTTACCFLKFKKTLFKNLIKSYFKVIFIELYWKQKLIKNGN